MSASSHHVISSPRLNVIAVLILITSAVTSAAVRRQRSDDGGPLEAVVQQLSQQLASLQAQVTSQAAAMAALQAKTATLQQTVAFQAWGSTNPVQALSNGVIILDHAATNIGDAYDPATGLFTAPLSGLYDLRAAIMAYDISHKPATHAAIYVDSSRQALALTDSRHGYYSQATVHTVLHVTKGQKVSLRNPDGTTSLYYDSMSEPYTTFSGFLIQAD